MVLLSLLLVLQEPAFADDVDRDQDGFSEDDGDCDDQNPEIKPGAEELCMDDLDNNCNRLFNEGCDLDVWTGTVGGGGGCSSTKTHTLFFGLMGLFALRRRRTL